MYYNADAKCNPLDGWNMEACDETYARVNISHGKLLIASSSFLIKSKGREGESNGS